VRGAIHRTRCWLLRQQAADGSWCGELEGDSALESETVLLLAFLGHEDTDLARQCAARLQETQLAEGGWARYPGGPAEVSGSVKAYFALKLTGHKPSAEYMRLARAAILALGGADAVNSLTRYFLALLAQISYEQCPAIPPEILLLPKWLPLGVHTIGAGARTTMVPLSIIAARRPVRRLEPRLGIRELFLREPEDWPAPRCPGLPDGTGRRDWRRASRALDRLGKWCQRRRLLPWRRKALAAAERWITSRFDQSDGLGGTHASIVWSTVALKCLGYPDGSTEVQYCRRQLQDLALEDKASGTTRIQPAKSPVGDTAMAVRALAASGLRPDHAAIRPAIRWLLGRQVRRRGDWAEKVAVEPGGWCAQYANDFYPDCDDTAAALLALKTQFSDAPEVPEALPPELRLLPVGSEQAGEEGQEIASVQDTTAAIERGVRWLLALQHRDGGWAAFDRDHGRAFLRYAPFADHHAMIDPSTPDLTGRVLDAMSQLGYRVGDTAVDRGVKYLRRAQNADGSWFARGGVHGIYGTSQALSGLVAAGVPTDDPAVVAGANWLLVHQQLGGGWGELPDSDEFPHLRGQGPITASQTAWAVLGLLAAGLGDQRAVTRGIRYLLVTQNDDGTWDEPEFTGTGIPQACSVRYHLYPIYFPLLALARWAVAAAPAGAAATRLAVVGQPAKEE
jgi:squalene-hopene/tetraprenyl-beta-curcumene cyclase